MLLLDLCWRNFRTSSEFPASGGRDIVARFAACFTDHRDPDLIEHPLVDLLKQRAFGLCLSYIVLRALCEFGLEQTPLAQVNTIRWKLLKIGAVIAAEALDLPISIAPDDSADQREPPTVRHHHQTPLIFSQKRASANPRPSLPRRCTTPTPIQATTR